MLFSQSYEIGHKQSRQAAIDENEPIIRKPKWERIVEICFVPEVFVHPDRLINYSNQKYKSIKDCLFYGRFLHLHSPLLALEMVAQTTGSRVLNNRNFLPDYIYIDQARV